MNQHNFTQELQICLILWNKEGKQHIFCRQFMTNNDNCFTIPYYCNHLRLIGTAKNYERITMTFFWYKFRFRNCHEATSLNMTEYHELSIFRCMSQQGQDNITSVRKNREKLRTKQGFCTCCSKHVIPICPAFILFRLLIDRQWFLTQTQNSKIQEIVVAQTGDKFGKINQNTVIE